MNEILLTNLFFIITGSAVLVVGTFLCFLCYHIIKIVRVAHTILERVETNTEVLARDVQALRDYFATGNIFGRILTGVVRIVMKVKEKNTPPQKKKDVTPTNEE